MPSTARALLSISEGNSTSSSSEESSSEKPALPYRQRWLGLMLGMLGIVATCFFSVMTASEPITVVAKPPPPSRNHGRQFAEDRQSVAQVVPHLGGFFTSEKFVKWFNWTPQRGSVEQAMYLTFPGRRGYPNWYFMEGNPTNITWEVLAKWIDVELLGGKDPFGVDATAPRQGQVVLPWPSSQPRDDQLSVGEWVSYSRRQVCFIVAKSLLGSNTQGYDNGLFRFLGAKPGLKDCTPRTGDFGKSMFGLLAACAADPGLQNGAQGPSLIVAKAKARLTLEEVIQASRNTTLEGSMLRTCHYSDGVQHADATAVPVEGCLPPTATQPGRDFMTGGKNRLVGQAIQDISAQFIGGYVFGNVCGLGGGQDERLLVYMPEVTALAFFLSQAPRPQLRAPAWVLGARTLFIGLDGSGRFGAQLLPDPDTPMRSDLVGVDVAGRTLEVSSSRPFLAFMSETQDFLGTPEERHGEDVLRARRNKHWLQRQTDPKTSYSFSNQVRAWYSAVALDSYHEAVRPSLHLLVRSIGSGPWMAGLWWGDSQLGVLASWLGQTIASSTWGGELPLDYYIYADFTENPGNQCFVLSAKQCHECLKRCVENPLPHGAYWLPSWALQKMHSPSTKPMYCAGFSSDCGSHGLEAIVSAFSSRPSAVLWRVLESTLRNSRGDVTRSVFDLLLDSPSLQGQ